MCIFQRECRVETFKELCQVCWREHGRGAAAKVESGDFGMICQPKVSSMLCFGENGVQERAYIGVTGSVLVEGAVRADPVAKGDVDVKNQDLEWVRCPILVVGCVIRYSSRRNRRRRRFLCR